MLPDEEEGADLALRAADLRRGGRVAAWCIAVSLGAAAAAAALSRGALCGAAALCVAFGLRHGVGADHIAIIGGATRQLAAKGQSAALAGLWFSAGHTLSVLLICSAVAASVAFLRTSAARWWSDALGFLASAALLAAVGAANIPLCRRLLASWRAREYWEFADHEHRTRRDPGAPPPPESWVDRVLGQGFDAAWKLLPVGFVVGAFALQSFTELMLVSITAAAVHDGSLAAALCLPVAWAGAMGAADSVDSAVMLWGYTRATNKQRMFFNLCLTVSSTALCFALAAVEVGATVATVPGAARWPVVGRAVAPFAYLTDHFWMVGAAVVAAYAASIVTAVTYFRRYERPEYDVGEPEARPLAARAYGDLTAQILRAPPVDRSGIDD